VATVDRTFTVNAKPAVVFAYLTDPEKATLWQSSLVEAQLEPEGPLRAGTQIHEVRKLLGRRMESTVDVTELEPEHVFAGHVRAGPVPWRFRYRFEESGESTRIELHMEGEPGGFFRVAEPLVVRTVEKQLESDFATLKQLVESGESGDG
jgi:carbon monoxide dehydrogenase subunit G